MFRGCGDGGIGEGALTDGERAPLRLTLLVFSATGNTRYVAGYLERVFEALPVAVEIVSVERVAPEAVEGFDVLGFGFPVFEGDSPRFVREYIARLSPGEGRGAFVFCTKGALAGNAERKNLQRLQDRGYVPLGGMGAVMPGTDGMAFVSKEGRYARWAQTKDFDSLEAVDRFAGRMGETLADLAGGVLAADRAEMVPLSILGVLIDPLWAAAYSSPLCQVAISRFSAMAAESGPPSSVSSAVSLT